MAIADGMPMPMMACLADADNDADDADDADALP
jgi:hypothetical protein